MDIEGAFRILFCYCQIVRSHSSLWRTVSNVLLRVFRHPASIFFERGVADLVNMRMSSLCCEKAPGHSFLAVTFAVDGETSEAYLKREEEFSFDIAPFTALDASTAPTPSGVGLICVDSSDETYIARWGQAMYEEKYLSRGLKGIWCYDENSGIEPCWVYLRHCYLSAQNLGPAVLDSFLDDTFLADRKTTIRQYLNSHPDVLTTMPPDNLIGRYSG